MHLLYRVSAAAGIRGTEYLRRRIMAAVPAVSTAYRRVQQRPAPPTNVRRRGVTTYSMVAEVKA